MIVIGIDPGTAIMGYGIIDYQNSKHKSLAYGVIRTNKDQTTEDRLKQLFHGVNRLLDEYKPDVMAVEELFFNRNSTTAISVGQARGVALLAAGLREIPVGEYTPLQVKQAVVGYGRAEKHQVQYMITKILGLIEAPKPDDAADALAVAICYCQFGGKSSWQSTKRKVEGNA
ncbi:MAG: crossover junction endodeoxyribonuclease RuvC [Peptococcaceae bacterium]|jgi:crossover junction endodeoxyribonuclease RuvC|nr:crossover junction endodeoxyribonuclease RuvC [Peptococcaceae bacterium]